MNPGNIYKEITEYSKVFLSFNPVYLSAIVLLMISFVVYIMNKYIIIPSQLTQLKLENENTRLLALFAELDPDPLLRINNDGVIIQANRMTEFLFGKRLEGENITSVLPFIKSPAGAISSNNSQTFVTRLFDKHYCIFFRGISEMNFAQIYFRDITEQKTYEEKLKNFSNHLQHSIEDERSRIAKDLHDSIGQNLSLAKFKLQMLNDKTPDKMPPDDFNEAKNLLEKSIRELKDISYNLKSQILDEIGLEPALISLCGNVSKASSIHGQIQFEEPKRKLNKNQETALYRITQEALNNITKHSAADEFSIRVFQDEGNVRLIISDNGKGFDFESVNLKSSTDKRMGLISMKERAESIGGHFEIETSPGEGTIIIVELPVLKGEI